MADGERRGSTSLADWAQVASAVVGTVAAIVAAVIGWQTIEQGKVQDGQARTLHALQFYTTYNSPNMLEIRHKLGNEDWCVHYGYIPPDQGSPPKAKAEEILVMVDFFDAVYDACFSENLCNEDFARQLFGPYAKDFYDDLSEAIVESRERGGRGDRFGLGIASLAASGDKADDRAKRGEPVPLATLRQVAANYKSQCTVSSPTPIIP